MNQRTFSERETVDFIVIGSGASGGIFAKELSTAGFNVLVLEQGPWQPSSQFSHDELRVERQAEMLNTGIEPYQSYRKTEHDRSVRNSGRNLLYRRAVGGSGVHYAGNSWRLRSSDFRERSMLGAMSGTGLADWPVTYDELEPYYTRAEWELGVSGEPGPFDPARSRGYPLPPLPIKSSGVLLERGARALGLHPQVSPMAILSKPYDGRMPCMACGHCAYYGCEFGAKSSTFVTMLPKAMATGRCEIRPDSIVFRIETNASGKATGVLYWDKEGRERRQHARAIVLAANGAETPRLLLLSASPRFPHGLANSSGAVGRHIMFNGFGGAFGRFEHPINEYKGPVNSRIVLDYYETDPKRGFYGGGGIDARFNYGPINFALGILPEHTPTWGAGFKHALTDEYAFTHSVRFAAHLTTMPMPTNTVTLDVDHRDPWGRPGLRLTYTDHPDDVKALHWFNDRTEELLQAAGAVRTWRLPVLPTTGGVQLLGTARMGSNPDDSVVDRFNRAHDVPNLFICDGSSFVTSGRGQPTLTIQALAFRAAENAARMAKANEL